MEPIGIISLITTAIPFVTSVVKKIVKTNRLSENKKHGVNTLIPIVLGILSSGVYSYSQNGDWITSLAIGLGSGGAASSGRNIEKNLIRLIESIGKLIKKKQ